MIEELSKHREGQLVQESCNRVVDYNVVITAFGDDTRKRHRQLFWSVKHVPLYVEAIAVSSFRTEVVLDQCFSTSFFQPSAPFDIFSPLPPPPHKKTLLDDEFLQDLNN